MGELHKELFRTAARKLTPLAAHIDLTYRCNFRCTHCYIPEHGGPELSTAEVFALLDDLARAGTMFLIFSGGEVFLRRDLFEILAYARRLGFHVRLFTDGYLIDARNAERLAELHVAEVHVSLYSTHGATFDRITQVPGSLERVLSGIRNLRARDLKVTVKTPVLKEAAATALDVIDFAKEHGCDVRLDASVIPQRDGCADPVVQHGMDGDMLRNVLDRLNAATNEIIQPFEPGSRDDWSLCGAGRSTVHVEPSGQVNPCVILPKAAGNVHERSFAEIWREAPLLQEIRGFTQKDRSGCRGCMNMGFCNFCMGRSYLSTGALLEPAAVMCNQSHARAELFRGRISAEDALPILMEPPPHHAPQTAESALSVDAGLVQLRRPPATPSMSHPRFQPQQARPEGQPQTPPSPEGQQQAPSLPEGQQQTYAPIRPTLGDREVSS